jgi:phosphate starvation-inducible protein PhoH and related proteins
MERPPLKSADFSENLNFEDTGIVKALCGEHDGNLKVLGKRLAVKIHVRGSQFTLHGPCTAIMTAKKILQDLYYIVESGYRLSSVDVVHAIKMIEQNAPLHMKDIFLDTIILTAKRRPITPKSYAQKKYVDAIRSFDIVFGIGPAGTGKTYLAMAMGIAALMKKDVDRIILARPAVEAGEKLGFLPGDLAEKVNPYLRPLYDALHDIMDMQRAQEMLHQGAIEVAPLAFMRGRTLNDSFVILDEAQNTTTEQMKMFLTRLGFNSKAIITGDITQIDLPQATASGLVQAQRVLDKVEGIQFCYFTEKDVVRHPLVEGIIKAYESFTEKDKRR